MVPLIQALDILLELKIKSLHFYLDDPISRPSSNSHLGLLFFVDLCGYKEATLKDKTKLSSPYFLIFLPSNNMVSGPSSSMTN